MKKTEAWDRLHFIVKSFVMGQIGAYITLIIVFFVGRVNAVELFIVGAFAYFFCLVLLRIGDRGIEFITRKVLKFLDKHPHTRNFILKYF